MPRQVPSLYTADDFKYRLGQLDPEGLIYPWQAGAICTKSLSYFSERRAKKLPPDYLQFGAKSVRYKIGVIREFKAQLERELAAEAAIRRASHAAKKKDDDNLLSGAELSALKKAGQRQGVHPNLMSFITQGHADDEYPFTVSNGRLFDFFESLGKEFDDSAHVLWYTLDEYLTERLNQARHDQAVQLHETLRVERLAADDLPNSKPSKPSKRI